ncbi:hypothetical protein IW261DRAFT_1477686 [Armillaria novae-zelandiae]|uniref:Zn(2)-C6 fungal-type domain-containing protein n=1 Tax=Armillaria novae-zelandiae TaxID=153914 RepID=A0AA39P8D2_9AGAR|nr:hypothetical protein IW261DRAFT_1477686 [Armillaria novae-zelandiae]
MAPIRPHQKTRTGCQTCKQHKVKCDKSLPFCNNCTKRGVECVGGSTSLRPESEQCMVVAQSSSAKSSLTLWMQGKVSADLLTLELMHHYPTSASYSLFPDPNASVAWRTVIPQMAFDLQNGCLLQAILAFSALHIHHENSTSSQYADIATDYYNQAKFSLPMADADETVDINTVRLSLTLVSQYEFAAAPTVFPFHGNWYNTMCEVCHNGQKIRTEMQYSEFPSILSSILTSAPDIEELHDVSVRKAYEESIYYLKLAWGGSFNECLGLWWYTMSNTFLCLLEQGRPCALIILAHYCVMMKHVTQDGPWWAKKKWGDEAAKIIFALDRRWTPCLGWVLSQLDTGLNSQVFDLGAWVHVGEGDHFSFAPH